MEKNTSRREFFKKSMKGALGGLVAGASLLLLNERKDKPSFEGELLFDGEIEGRKTVYYDCGDSILKYQKWKKHQNRNL